MSKTTVAAVLTAVMTLPSAVFAQGMGMPAPPEMDPTTGTPAILKKVGIDQHIGNKVPLDLHFTDERGHVVRLGDYFGSRPVVLALVYYDCPMLCTQVLNGMVGSLKTMSFDAGRDFEVVVVSINPREGPKLAAEKKDAYVERYGRPATAGGWHFLTGDDASIHALADAIGFRYAYDENIGQYAHAAAIEVLTPAGIISRYLYGIDFAPRDLRFALIESSENKLGSKLDQVILLCYHYDPATGKYGTVVLRAVRIGGVLTLAALVTFMFVSLRRERRAGAAFESRN